MSLYRYNHMHIIYIQSYNSHVHVKIIRRCNVEHSASMSKYSITKRALKVIRNTPKIPCLPLLEHQNHPIGCGFYSAIYKAFHKKNVIANTKEPIITISSLFEFLEILI